LQFGVMVGGLLRSLRFLPGRQFLPGNLPAV